MPGGSDGARAGGAGGLGATSLEAPTVIDIGGEIAVPIRFAVEKSGYLTVIAATFDGAQRLANVQKLFGLAERFERSGAHLIRDFVKYVYDFEAIGSRESEGQIDQAADAVRLMTVHQAKGLEFPVVFIPDLQRLSRVATDTWVLLDRHQGLSRTLEYFRRKICQATPST